MSDMSKVYDLFRQKAEAVSAVVTEIGSIAEAFDYVVDICDKKEACKLLVAGCEENLSDKAEALCDAKQEKIICAPGFSKKDYAALEKRCKEKGFVLIDSGMRGHLAGIDIGVTHCAAGIAETGSIVVDSDSEELRLATMISEFHVAILPKSKVVADSYDYEADFLKRLKKGANYQAFITGASRTADIERVLAIGVHGPLELHILLLEDN